MTSNNQKLTAAQLRLLFMLADAKPGEGRYVSQLRGRGVRDVFSPRTIAAMVRDGLIRHCGRFETYALTADGERVLSTQPTVWG